MIVFGMLAVGVLVVGVVVMLALRRVTLDESRNLERLREPGTHALAYAVPTGQDPAVLMAALSSAGFSSVGDLERGNEVLLVDCPNQDDRAKVRSIIEHVTRTSFEGGGGEMHVGHVSFEDER